MVTSIRIRVTHVGGGEEQGVREDPCGVEPVGSAKGPCCKGGLTDDRLAATRSRS